MPIADQPTPHQKTLSRYFAIGCALIIGVSLSFFLYSFTDNLGNTKLRIEFESRARGYSNAVRNTLNEYLGISHFLKDYIVFNRDLNRQQFKQFANSVLHRYPGVQALSWNPLVKRNSRSIYENNARSEGFKEFSFTERSNTGTLVPTEEREEYVVVYFIEPLEKNKPALGYDIASNSIRRKAIASAFDTGKPIATARIKLVQETGHQFGTLILNPIYYDISPLDTVEERRSSRKGLAHRVNL